MIVLIGARMHCGGVALLSKVGVGERSCTDICADMWSFQQEFGRSR
jgi:hypothetical protein